MRKNVRGVLGAVILFGALFAFGGTQKASAEIQVNVNLGPPPIRFAEPPEMVMVPNSQVYFVPQPDADLFYYNGYWWSPRGNQWYRANAYNGPWKTISRYRVPSPVYRVPKDYRAKYEKQQRIPYGQWKNQGKGNNGNNKGKKGK